MAGGGGTSGFGSGLWVADIEKMLLGEYWTNRYIVAAADLVAAQTIASQIVGYERAITLQNVLFTRYRVSDGVPETDVYLVANLNSFGTADNGGTALLPLFNVVRFDFNTAGGGRPSRKYMRGCLSEAHVNFNNLEALHVTGFNTNYATPMAGLAGFVDVDGQEITQGSVYPFVGMRQLRRGSKRKAPNGDSPPTGGTPV